MATKATIILGIGNPGEKYQNTRHNSGRIVVESLATHLKLDNFEFDKTLISYVTRGRVGSSQVKILLPETYINKSGEVIKKLITQNKNIASELIVVQDDLDLPLGTIKLVKNRGAGGHKGIESIIKALKTQDFIRLRIGIAKKNHLHKSQKKDEVINIVIGKFSPVEKDIFKKVVKKSVAALEDILTNSFEHAMTEYNKT